MSFTPILLLILTSIRAFAAVPSYADLAAGVKADKKPYFLELAREKPDDKRFQKALRTVLARLVICQVDSAFAEEACKALEALSSRNLGDFEPSQSNGRLILGAAAAAIRSVLPSLSPAAAAEGSRLLAEIGAIVANDQFTPDERALLARDLPGFPVLWKELGEGSLKAFADFWAQLPAWLGRAPDAPWVNRLVTDEITVCAILNDQVRCDGSNRYSQLDPPPFSHPRILAADGGTFCALDDKGVKCWGKTTPLSRVPQDLSHPYFLRVAGGRAFVLDDKGVRTWPANAKDPSLDYFDPTDVDYDPDFGTICVRYAGKETCDRARNPKWQPFDHRPVETVKFGGSSCTLVDQRLRCPVLMGVGARDFTPPDLGDVSRLEIFSPNSLYGYEGYPIANGWACALDSGHTRCWGFGADAHPSAAMQSAASPGPIDDFALAGRFCPDGSYHRYLLCEKTGTKLHCSYIPLGSPETPLGSFDTEISAGARLIPGKPCIVDAEGFSCIQWDGSKPLSTASLRRVVAASAPGAVSAPNLEYEDSFSKLPTCWGENGEVRCGMLQPSGFQALPAAEPPPELGVRNPALLAIAHEIACAVDAVGVKCWQTSPPNVAPPGNRTGRAVHTFRNPRQLVTFDDILDFRFYACVLDDDGVQCWLGGDDWKTLEMGSLPVPVLDHPRQLAIAGPEVCALDRAGMRCWWYY